MYYIAVRDRNGDYFIDETIEDWHDAVDESEPIDCVNGEMVIYDEQGHKYLVGPTMDMDLHEKKSFWVNTVYVGRWDSEKGEPYLIDTKEIVPDELRQLLADYKNEDIDDDGKGTLIKKYETKVLAFRNYESVENPKDHFTISDFVDRKMFMDIIIEISEGKCIITPEGKAFTADYYGFENIAKALIDADVELFEIDDKDKNSKLDAYIAWFKDMDTAPYIVSIKDDLSPPN